jgi:purine nucleosidase
VSDKIPVILDTDIGSDIDDAVCLAYLLRQSRCDLLGVTTATGDTGQRASLAALICEAADRPDIPVHRGSPGPLMNGPGQPNVPQYDAIRDRDHRTDFEPYSAVSFLQRTIRERPNEITLLAIGPMTNLGLLFSLDPEIPSLLKELVLMCGVFTAGNGHGPGSREWNAMSDPAATAITYKARPPRFTSVGLEVTTKCVLGADECRDRFRKAAGPLTIVADMAEVWFRGRQAITFHDPLASAVMFEPGLCEYADGEVSVHASGHGIAGLTAFDRRADEKPHRVATQVDSEAFFTHYFDVVGG